MKIWPGCGPALTIWQCNGEVWRRGRRWNSLFCSRGPGGRVRANLDWKVALTRPTGPRLQKKRSGVRYATRPQQFLNFFPLPQGHGSFRPTLGVSRRTGARSSFNSEPSPFEETASPVADIRSPCRPGTGPVAVAALGACSLRRNCGRVRSEEHTSELQSPCNLECRLL